MGDELKEACRGMTKTAKQLEEEMIVKPDPDSTTQFEPFYEASVEQFQTYRTQLLREQREICADESGADESSGMYESIKNAPEP